MAFFVIPAKAGIYIFQQLVGSDVRRRVDVRGLLRIHLA
jgi:hypothetical protein